MPALPPFSGQRVVVLEHPLAFILGPDETMHESVPMLAQRLLDSTREYWNDWVRSLAVPFEWQEAVIRAAITLKLCSYEDTGAIIAAVTTSIPESPNSGRNWDYRFCWIRDSYFTSRRSIASAPRAPWRATCASSRT